MSSARSPNFWTAIPTAEFRKMLLRELDYTQEARSLQTLHTNLAGFKRILVPLPIDDYCSSRVLTMEYVTGTKITTLSPVVRIEVDVDAFCRRTFPRLLAADSG